MFILKMDSKRRNKSLQIIKKKINKVVLDHILLLYLINGLLICTATWH
jgi:hypothetical protein